MSSLPQLRLHAPLFQRSQQGIWSGLQPRTRTLLGKRIPSYWLLQYQQGTGSHSRRESRFLSLGHCKFSECTSRCRR